MIAVEKGSRNVSLAAPSSPWTWETRVLLPGGVAKSIMVPVEFRRPVEIVAFIPTIYVLRPRVMGLEDPTADDIECYLNVDRQDILTNQANGTTTAEDPLVTLAALAIQLPRVVCAFLPAANPQIQVQVQWKQDPTDATNPGPFFNDVEIGLAMIPRFLTDKEVERYRE